MTNAELSAKVLEAEGRVFIGFKDINTSAGVDETGQVLASVASIEAAKTLLRGLGLSFEFEFIDMPTVVTRIPSTLVSELRSDPLIEYIEPILPGVRLAETTTWNVERVQAPGAWPYSTGAGGKLLIIDSGVRNDHPDLAPAVVQSCENPPTDGLDIDGHGTNVAGVAAAVQNDVQHVGVAYGVALWSSKDGNAIPDPAYTACGVQFGRVNGVHAINISSSFAPYTAVTDQINAAYNQNGIVVVVAAGSTGPVSYPATLATAIAVSATDISDAITSFSATGPKIEFAAPGHDILTTCLGGDSCPVEGTSFSAPHVAAAAALLKSFNPTWTNMVIRDRLQQTATDLGAAGRDNLFGYGLLNVRAALEYVPPPPPLAPPTTCQLEKIPPPANYLRVSWTNSGESGVSTEVSIYRSGFGWSVVATKAPGITEHFYSPPGGGLYQARVRHVKSSSTPSTYCTTGTVTV